MEWGVFLEFGFGFLQLGYTFYWLFMAFMEFSCLLLIFLFLFYGYVWMAQTGKTFNGCFFTHTFLGGSDGGRFFLCVLVL